MFGREQDDTASKPAALFGGFSARLVAFAADFAAVIFVALPVRQYLLAPIGIVEFDNRLLVAALLWLYFTAFWASPLRATPSQLLLGLRIVDRSGGTIGLARAAWRSALLVGLFTAAFLLFRMPPNALLTVVALLGYAALFLAAVTPTRQGAHDMLAKSLVVRRRTLNRPERLEELRAKIADTDPASGAKLRPSALRMVIDVIVLAIPVYVLWLVAQVNYDRDLQHRTGYAIARTGNLKSEISAHYEAYGTWPDGPGDLSIPARYDYPDGGYYELVRDGAIRIRFTVLPDLVKGSLLVQPTAGEDGVSWVCEPEGGIEPKHLPASCRGN